MSEAGVDLPIWMAICGCQVTMDRDTGEPLAWVTECDRHTAAGAAPGVIAAESRARTIAVMAISAQANVDIGLLAASTNPDGSAHAVSPDGAWVADVQPLTLQQYLDAHPNAASFAKAA